MTKNRRDEELLIAKMKTNLAEGKTTPCKTEEIYADASPIEKNISPEPKNPEPEIDIVKEKKRLKNLCYYHFLYATNGKRTSDAVDRAFISELNDHINRNDYLAAESKKILGIINALDKEDDPWGRIELMDRFSKNNPNNKEWKDYLDEKFEKDMSIANLNIEENMAGLANSAPASDELCSNSNPDTDTEGLDLDGEKKRLMELCYYCFSMTPRLDNCVAKGFIAEIDKHINDGDELAEVSKKYKKLINDFKNQPNPLDNLELRIRYASPDDTFLAEWQSFLYEKRLKDYNDIMLVTSTEARELRRKENSSEHESALDTTPNAEPCHEDEACGYEYVNHPSHYNLYDVEVVDMMRRIWGSEKTAIWCELNAFKYRMRMGLKPNSDLNEDFRKEQWYLAKAKEILG